MSNGIVAFNIAVLDQDKMATFSISKKLLAGYVVKIQTLGGTVETERNFDHFPTREEVSEVHQNSLWFEDFSTEQVDELYLKASQLNA